MRKSQKVPAEALFRALKAKDRSYETPLGAVEGCDLLIFLCDF
jgi:hypothetical protein